VRVGSGAFWIGLEASRRSGLRVQGEPVAELDYSSMFARLAYARLGVDAPEGDLYAIPGLEGHYRSGVKLAFNVLLFDGKGTRRKWPAEMQGLLPEGWELDPPRLRKAILAEHPALGKAFGRSLGYGLMFTESGILMAVLDELMVRGIEGLYLYDGLLVARSKATEVLEVMRDKALEVAGVRLPVMLKVVA
jgi:hypothetical protein